MACLLKFGMAKPSKIWRDFCQLSTLIANISEMDPQIQNRKSSWSWSTTTLPRWTKKDRSTNRHFCPKIYAWKISEMPKIYIVFVRKYFLIFGGWGNPLTRRLLRLWILCATTLRPSFSLQTTSKGSGGREWERKRRRGRGGERTTNGPQTGSTNEKVIDVHIVPPKCTLF